MTHFKGTLHEATDTTQRVLQLIIRGNSVCKEAFKGQLTVQRLYTFVATKQISCSAFNKGINTQSEVHSDIRMKRKELQDDMQPSENKTFVQKVQNVIFKFRRNGSPEDRQTKDIPRTAYIALK